MIMILLYASCDILRDTDLLTNLHFRIDVDLSVTAKMTDNEKKKNASLFRIQRYSVRTMNGRSRFKYQPAKYSWLAALIFQDYPYEM